MEIIIKNTRSPVKQRGLALFSLFFLSKFIKRFFISSVKKKNQMSKKQIVGKRNAYIDEWYDEFVQMGM